jgi:hypothetical protein
MNQHPLACCYNNKSMSLWLIEVKEGEDLQKRFVNAPLGALHYFIQYSTRILLPLASIKAATTASDLDSRI